MRRVKIVIPDERPMSWNKLYAGSHWSKRKDEADRVHQLVRAYLDIDEPVFSVPVEILFRVYFENRPLDASNITTKMYEDGLIGYLIHDDSPEWVARHIVESRIDKDNPRVEIVITEYHHVSGVIDYE